MSAVLPRVSMFLIMWTPGEDHHLVLQPGDGPAHASTIPESHYLLLGSQSQLSPLSPIEPAAIVEVVTTMTP